MKIYNGWNYVVRVLPAEAWIDGRLGVYLPNSYVINVNGLLNISVVGWFPSSPWPPRFPEDLDVIESRDDAVRHVVAVTDVVVSPASTAAMSVQSFAFPEDPESPRTVFWLSRERYDELWRDLERFFEEPSSGSSYHRLDELGGRAVAEFLRADLPRADLTKRQREILCLPDKHQ